VGRSRMLTGRTLWRESSIALSSDNVLRLCDEESDTTIVNEVWSARVLAADLTPCFSIFFALTQVRLRIQELYAIIRSPHPISILKVRAFKINNRIILFQISTVRLRRSFFLTLVCNVRC
jgi:hypothetical protein